jgi:4-hydroxyacetophenone monooxygenase
METPTQDVSAKALNGDGGPTDAFVANALKMANLNALRMAVYQATRDPELEHMSVSSAPFWGGAFDIPTLDEKHAEAVRQKAREYIDDGLPERQSKPSTTDMRRMMEMFVGAPVSDFAFAMGKNDLEDLEFPLGVEWDNEPSNEAKQKFKVIVIGAGFAGLTTAVQLSRLGVPYTVIERNAGVGGTWWTNDYPEARVDIASHHYQLSFMKNRAWKYWFAPQQELKDYAEAVATKYDLKRNIRFNTELTGAKWDEHSTTWRVTLLGPDEQVETVQANALISAAGLFNAPNMPDIPGIATFRGKMFHTTQWDHDYDYSGKRIAQIGVGSTGAQLLPGITKKAAHVTVFQRSPQWVSAIPGYRDAIPEEIQWLFDNFPYYYNWYCFLNTFINFGADPEGLQNFDPNWRNEGGIVAKRNDAVRQHNLGYIQEKVGHNPELAKKLTPDFPPFAKRPVVDNGWFDALNRANVDLVTEKIERITPFGIATSDGVERDFDLILLCAGFKTERYLWPVTYEGRRGMTLEKAWSTDGARAYLGMAVHDFPNLFIIYGPNAQARSGGLIAWLEIWSRYAVKSVAKMVERGIRTMDVKQEVSDAYNTRMDEAMTNTVWSVVKTYYVNEHGRQGTNMPWYPSRYYDWIREPNLDDYDLT